MKKTIDLLNEAMELGFDRETALESIDASLDNEVGFENRKPLMEEARSCTKAFSKDSGRRPRHERRQTCRAHGHGSIQDPSLGGRNGKNISSAAIFHSDRDGAFTVWMERISSYDGFSRRKRDSE